MMAKNTNSIENPELKVHIDSQERALLFLMHNPKMSFNELWNKDGKSNKFAYHLKTLIKKKLVEKTKDGRYQLTVAGKRKVSYIETYVNYIENYGGACDFPIIGLSILVSKGDEYLMIKRSKEPFYGYWGFLSGKLRSTNYILEQAEESLKRETGLKCDLELKGLFSSKTYVNNNFAYNHQLFIIKATNPKGTLLKETLKGINEWVNKEKINNLQILPNLPLLIKIANGKSFEWVEADRFQEEEKFTMDVKKEVIF